MPDDDIPEEDEGFILCLDIDQGLLDARDRGRTEFVDNRRYILVIITDNDGKALVEVQDYKLRLAVYTILLQSSAGSCYRLLIFYCYGTCQRPWKLQLYSWFQS